MNNQLITVSEEKEATIVTLNRPDKRNALNGDMVKALTEVLDDLDRKAVRMLILAGAGEHFCAGGDINWMKQVTANRDQNKTDAEALATLLFKLYHFKAPTLALAKGAVLGGGLGLIAAADIVFAEHATSFGFPEVKLGIAPSVISPYVIAALGERQATYYFLTGERFDVQDAKRLGLVHRVVTDQSSLAFAKTFAIELLKNGQEAMQAVKKLIRSLVNENITKELSLKTAEHLAALRSSAEGQEGLSAFLEKRPAKWAVF